MKLSSRRAFTTAAISLLNDVGDPDLNDGQGNCNGTRTQATQALVDWLATDPTGRGDPDVLIIGDLNSYTNEDPINAILAGVDDSAGSDDDYTNLVHTFGGAGARGTLAAGQRTRCYRSEQYAAQSAHRGDEVVIREAAIGRGSSRNVIEAGVKSNERGRTRFTAVRAGRGGLCAYRRGGAPG